MRGVNEEDPFGPAERFAFLQVRTVNLLNYQLVPCFFSPGCLCGLCISDTGIILLILSGTRDSLVPFNNNNNNNNNIY